MSKLDRSLRDLEKRLRDEPNNLGLRVLVAAALREAGKNSDAVELYRSVAIAYRDQGRTQQAIAVCKSILEIAPGDPISTNLMAQLSANQAPRARESNSVAAAVLEIPSITPPPPPSNPPTSPPPPIRPQTARPRTPPPVPAAPVVPPPRRSSFEETPLPKPLPYHVADPTTSSLEKMSARDIPVTDDSDTRPSGPKTARGSDVDGLAAAARRISASLIAAARSASDDEDISIELETRRVPRIDTRELQKISAPPPTVPTERVSPLGLADDDLPTANREALGNDDPTRDSKEPTREVDTEDELTAPVELPAGTRPPPLPPKKR